MTTILILVLLALGGWLVLTLVRGRDGASQDGTADFARAMEAISRPSPPDRRARPRTRRRRLRPPGRRPFRARRARRREPR